MQAGFLTTTNSEKQNKALTTPMAFPAEGEMDGGDSNAMYSTGSGPAPNPAISAEPC